MDNLESWEVEAVALKTFQKIMKKRLKIALSAGRTTKTSLAEAFGICLADKVIDCDVMDVILLGAAKYSTKEEIQQYVRNICSGNFTCDPLKERCNDSPFAWTFAERGIPTSSKINAAIVNGFMARAQEIWDDAAIDAVDEAIQEDVASDSVGD